MTLPAIDLYPPSRSLQLDLAEFRNPSAIYRGAPFWSWNNKLDIAQLRRQIDCFREMGFGGFHMHPRSGLDTEYMGPEFLAAVQACVRHAKQTKMVAWLYDEDRWPSGFAGGLVTREPRFRAQHLVFTPRPYGAPAGPAEADRPEVWNPWKRTDRGTLLARYDVVLDAEGLLASYRRLGAGAQAQGTTWYAYVETDGDHPWYNGQAYVNTLSRPAIEKFIEVTHERYFQAVGASFGAEVPAIFTDEPQFCPKRQLGGAGKRQLDAAEDSQDVIVPWTDDLPQSYAAAYDQHLEDHLPELFWELPDGRASVVRYRYHDHVAERFAAAFADTIGSWCARHGIALTGHLMEEGTLGSQTAAVGDAMRSYRSFQLPGIDMLCDAREYNTAKQAQSAVHQYGRSGMASELYGVTDWDYPFLGHKAQGDWQAALGVTVRVPHLAWVSMAGEAKRDYPASIFYQSPWYREYPLVEDHFARLNTALTRGRPAVRVGVIHPVESYWLDFGPLEQTKMRRQVREDCFRDLTAWLLFGLIDFDFICESLLPSQAPARGGAPFQVGSMAYDVVVVPALRTIRATTLERLEAFAAAGGTVLFAGEIPTLLDAQPSDRPAQFARRCTAVPFHRTAILGALDPYRDLEIRHEDGGPADSLLYQMRVDGSGRTLFICNTDRLHDRPNTQIKVRGRWTVSALNTFTGTVTPLTAHEEGPWTVVAWDFTAHGHALLSFAPPGPPTPAPATPVTAKWQETARLEDPVPVTLSEPNVLLLDQAQWKIDAGPWQPLEEILRLENLVRIQLGLGPQTGGNAQPWTDRAEAKILAQVTLRFTIVSDVAVTDPQLALEDAAARTVVFDGAPVRREVTGYYVDEAIPTVKLPSFAAGTHSLEVTIPYHRKSVIEWHYLLGDFGVQVRGRHARIVAPVRTLAFGDWTGQGLPFYTGNVTYHATIRGDGRPHALLVPYFRVPLLSVALDGHAVGKIAFAPFRVELGPLSAASHRLDITAFGHRFNGFGSLHWADPGPWVGPGAWRTTGTGWCYEYHLKPMGILVSPLVQTLSPLPPGEG
jgi:hypothetical protein